MAASKCDEVLAALVVKRIAAGAPIPVACAAEGVSRQNLEQWRRRAETGDAATLHFLAEVERAHARFISQRVVNIAAAGFAAGDDDGPGGDWKADAWLAERMDPESFAPSSVLVIKAEATANGKALSAIDAVSAAHPEPLTGAQWRLLVLSALAGEVDGDDEAEHVEH